MKSAKTLLVFALALVAGLSAQASPIFQDGFNHVTGVPVFTTQNSGSFGVPPWSVGGSGIDWIGSYWSPAEGNGSVDLAGDGPGSVSATLPTVAGGHYLVNFSMAGNPDAGPIVKELRVQVGDLNQLFQFDTTGRSLQDMGWVAHTAAFQAAGNDILTFSSTGTNAWGPALDSVSVVQNPEPGTYLLVGLGLAGLAALRRR